MLSLAHEPERRRRGVEATGRAPRRSCAGYTVIELSVAVMLIGVLASMAALAVPSAVQSARADAALNRIVSELRRAKELAIAERRDMEVRFMGTKEVQIVRHEVPTGTTLISSVLLEDGMVYQVAAGLPDTPDQFGNGTAVSFGAATTLLFRSEGIFTDSNANLDPLNGTVFLGAPDQPLSARALTVFGPTALIRAYRWNGQRWVE
jgi:prepilin-type N-terminal cleavage/methylation domain-containing protein